MIISHRHKFIFLKTNKTAGTSVEIALSRYCGPEDVITPISPEDEAIRQSLGYPGAQNFKLPLKQSITHYLRHREWPRLYNHMSAKEVIRIIGQETWSEYFTFCFERNPWARAISLYLWDWLEKRGGSFSDFLHSYKLNHLKTKGSDLYLDGDQVLVDRICRYENLVDELQWLSTGLGLPGELAAPRTKDQTRSSRSELQLTQADVDYIGDRFATEIQRFGYTYQSITPSRKAPQPTCQ